MVFLEKQERKRKAGDETILARNIRNGDVRSFEILYQRYHRQLHNLAVKYLKQQVLAEDAVQEIYLKIWLHREELDELRSVKGLLFTMMRNHLLNRLRDQKREILSGYRADMAVGGVSVMAEKMRDISGECIIWM